MKDNAAFVADFKESHRWVDKVEHWLRGLGYEVRKPRPQLRPDADVRRFYSDKGDLLVWSPDARMSKVVEVKHRAVDFTNAVDYPYPTIIVNEWYKLPQVKLDSLFGYVIVNRPGTHVAVVTPDTSVVWKRQERWDSAQKRWCEFAVCPVSFAKFYQLPNA